MTQVERQSKWLSHSTSVIEEQIIYNDTDFVTQHQPNTEESYLDQVPMIVIESNQVSAVTDAPMIIVTNDDVTSHNICAEEVVETETDAGWYTSPNVVYEETVKTEAPDIKPFRGEGRVAVPYLLEPEDASEIPLNDASYATYHPFPCDFCSRRFKKKANLMNHMVAHQTQRPHSCSICSSRFMRKCDLVNHQKIHSYLPNRENRDDISDDKYTRSYVKKKGKRTKLTNIKKSAFKPKPESSKPNDNNYFKPTSYVDEDVKLLLEMTNRLHETRKGEELDKSNDKVLNSLPEFPTATEAKPYVCSRCGKSFAREKALYSHSQVHAEDSRYECGRCGDRFFTLELLREHSAKKHESSFTGETSESSEEEDSEHGGYTGDERFGSFYCSTCGISFNKIQHLKRHKKMHGKKDDPTITPRCMTCLSMFSSEEKLTLHLETNLSCQRHVCLLCGKHCNDPSSLQRHIEWTHSEDMPPNTCQLCGKQCKDKRALQKHCWIHSNDKRFSCKKAECPKRFHSWARLRRHMLSHNTSKAVRCEECDEEFPDRRALINHRHSHFPDSHSRRFVCNECGKSFGSRSSQQIHNRIHTGERPYGCRYCWKAFADGGTLRKHERIHTGEKPYACVVCPRAFNQRVVLREHIRSHHSGSVSKPGYSTPVYLCPVCAIVRASSDELAVHLVKHSDENTFKNRNPQPGIRTYKRRKKLTASDYDVDNEFDDEDFFEPKTSYETSESEREESVKSSPVRKSTRKNRKVDNYAKFTKSYEAAMKNIKSLVDTKPIVKKAKMINTKPKQNLKTNFNKKLQNKTKKKTIRVNKTNINSINKTNKDLSNNIDVKIKNIDNNDKNKKIRKPVAFQKKQTDCESVDIKIEIENAEEDGYNCGICNATFPSKADLLFHVPVHI